MSAIKFILPWEPESPYARACSGCGARAGHDLDGWHLLKFTSQVKRFAPHTLWLCPDCAGTDGQHVHEQIVVFERTVTTAKDTFVWWVGGKGEHPDPRPYCRRKYWSRR